MNEFQRVLGHYSQQSQGINYSYCDPETKDAFHRRGKKVLRELAKALGLSPEEYDLRSNKGGIAVSGEITLHTDCVYVQIYQSHDGRRMIMFRNCEDRFDFTGGQNHFISLHADPEEIFSSIKRLTL